ncbi:MAG TPA: ScpA family protein [Acidimicrobiales bacterium]|nr:ScpA family protein [Acidimicrobiales bacterium]
MAYEVHIDVFDGPFDLLLRLIAAQQVDVYEVRLADIVDAFLTEMRRLGTLDLELATQFLLVAATLVELKCRRLLPGSGEVDLDDDLALFEARDYLLARLVECKTFSAAASVLALLERSAQRSLARRAGPDERFDRCAPDLLAGVTPEQLAAVAERAFAARPLEPSYVPYPSGEDVSVHATIEELVSSLPGRGRVSFRVLTAGAASPAHVVACFLALLELYKQSLVDLEQSETFGELTVVWSARGPVEPADVVSDAYDAAELEAASAGMAGRRVVPRAGSGRATPVGATVPQRTPGPTDAGGAR